MNVKIKNTCLATSRIMDYALSESIMMDLREKLVGAQVYLGEPQFLDGDRGRKFYDAIGVVESVSGDELSINIFTENEDEMRSLLTAEGLASNLDIAVHTKAQEVESLAYVHGVYIAPDGRQ